LNLSHQIIYLFIYLFIRQDIDLKSEYDRGWKLTEIFPVNTLGFQTHRDHFAVDFSRKEIQDKINDFISTKLSNEQIKAKYELKDTETWNVESARIQVRRDQNWQQWMIDCLYRPFDCRPCYFNTVAMDRPRNVLRQHMMRVNLSLNLVRQTKAAEWGHALVADKPTPALYVELKDGCNAFPLYLYPDTENEQGNLFTDRTPNLSQKFLSAIREKLGYIPTPEAIFYYAYAVFHSPTYRQRYAEFLKIDFPRLPLTRDNEIFTALAKKGEELVALHLMKSKNLNKVITKYPVNGDNAVSEVTYNESERRIYINKQQYFEGVPAEVWAFKVGGYQVLDKWLKDRKKANRSLSFDDVLHYQRVVVVLKETMQIMAEIDEVIPGFPWE
jgi:predicted helicase